MNVAPEGPACSDVNARRIRGPLRPMYLSGMVLASLAAFHTAAIAATRTAPAATDQPHGVIATVSSAHSTLAVFMEDLHQILPLGIVWEHEFRAGTVPHALVYLGGADLAEGQLGDALRATVDLARNYGLYVESQRGGGPEWGAGAIVSPRFPTINFCWEVHPFEDVPAAGGLWHQPFADLGDVVALSKQGETDFLHVDPRAVSRIDLHSARQGHRRFFIRMEGLEEELVLGPYIWMTGLDRVPLSPRPPGGTPPGGQVGELVKGMRLQFADRAAARARLADRLGMGAEALWTAPPERPRYREPFVLWVMQGDHDRGEVPAYAPWRERPGAEPRWVALRAGGVGEHSVALPDGWRLETGGDESLALVRDGAAPSPPEFGRFLRHHMGSTVAVLLEGEVVGTATIDVGWPEGLALTVGPGLDPTAIAARWEAARGAIAPAAGGAPPARIAKAEAPPSPTASDALPDFFQVRLMAEPQERKLIPVTHFAAPGAAPGVRVAVQNDVILDSRSVTGARLEQQADRLTLHLSLTDEGRDALSDACFNHLGKQLAIVYEDALLCAPTIVDWEQEELSFRGMNDDWPQVAEAMAERLGDS